MRHKKIRVLHLLAFSTALAWCSACRTEEPVLPPDIVPVNPSEKVTGGIQGFFLLNEGNMGTNKASLDYYSFRNGTYYRNIFGERNPDEVKDLGDVGNDIRIYGNKVYAVINCSNFVEVMDRTTGRHLTKIAIPNCRYLTFHEGNAYVSAYAGPVQIDQNARIGYVARIDTASLQVTGECTVGYQPEEMAVVGNRLYVANSGGYRAPDYDSTLSVIDLASFQEIRKIPVAINLHRVRADRNGLLYVSSRGDYYDIPSDTFLVDPESGSILKRFGLPNTNMALCGDSLYVLGASWNYNTSQYGVAYTVIDVRRQEISSHSFIRDGTEGQIRVPYGIAVHPAGHEIYLTDARDYVTPGILHCYSREGFRKWSVTTGDIPASFAFTDTALDGTE